jgi:hypothetical protein
MKRRLAIVCLLLMTACGSDDVVDDVEPDPPVTVPCGETELIRDGGCLVVGVPPERCGLGTLPNGLGGCDPVLPAEPCGLGMMALVGESECVPIVDCGTEPYAGIPVDAATIYVDGAAAPGGTGSLAQPFGRIEDAVMAAPPDALIAIAPGSYEEPLRLYEPVRLWGRCPADVHIVEPTTANAVEIVSADVELHGLHVHGAGAAMLMSGTETLLDGMQIGADGAVVILAADDFGAASLTIRRSVIEGPSRIGVGFGGGSLSMIDSEIRDIPPGPNQGVGLIAEPGMSGTPSVVNLDHVVIHRVGVVGVAADDSDLTVSNSFIGAFTTPAFEPGTGIQLEGTADICPTLNVISSVVVDAATTGIAVAGGTGVIDATTVYNIGDPAHAESINGIASGPMTAMSCPPLAIVESWVAGVAGVGIASSGPPLQIERSMVVDLVASAEGGSGIVLRPNTGLGPLVIRDSLVRNVFIGGIANGGGVLEVHGTRVEGARAEPGLGVFGDGIVGFPASGTQPVTVIDSSELIDNDRAGVSVFGADVTVSNTTMACNGFDLNRQDFLAFEANLVDAGGNRCGCGEDVACKVTDQELVPPALDP